MSEKWIKCRFDDYVTDATSKGCKLPQKLFHAQGRFAIVDQGKDFVAGYTDQEFGVYADIPAIIFGDHTRSLKYVDFPFFLGADGTKILKVDDIDVKYLYYYLDAHPVPNTGYNRHFSWLKKKVICAPNSSDEQRHIAEVLSTCDEVIEQSERAAEKYRQIKAGMLNDLLTRGIDNRGKLRPPPSVAPQRYKDSELGLIPKEWEVKRLGDCALISRGGSPRPIEDYVFENAEGYNWIKIGDVEPGAKYIVRTAEKMIPAGLVKTREVHVGDFLLSNSMSFGRPYILKIDGCIHDGWLAIQNYKETFDKEYLYYVLGAPMVLRQYGQLAAGSTVLNLKKEMVAKVLVAAPDSLAEQRAIAERLAAVDERIAAEVKTAEKYRKVKAGLMEKLLTPPVDAEIEDLTQEVAG